jgi:hypothetical protein
MKRVLLILVLLVFAGSNILHAQIKKEKIVKVIPPSISHYLDYSAYVWMCEKKDHSIKILDFEPYSENVALISKTKELKELNKNKFIYSITENDVMILKNSSTKIFLKIVTENNPLKLINTKTKETFIGKSKEDLRE